MYKLNPTANFLRKSKKVIREVKQKRSLKKALSLLQKDPFYKSLRTHKVNIKYENLQCFSSFVSGDLRIAWVFNRDKIEVIDLLDIGKHGIYK